MSIIQCLIFLVIWDLCSCSKTSKTTELLKNLTTDYSPDLRPGLDKDDPLIVNITLNLVALTKLNEVEGYISTVEFFDITWADERISWEPELYENISYLSFRSDKVWSPELIISNPADKIYAFDEIPTMVRYNSDGLAFWRPGLVTKTLCDIQTPAYPFDVHACYISVILWGSIPSEIVLGSPLNTVVTAFYSRNSEWSLTGSTALASSTNQISSISFGLQFSRKSAFLMINIVIPIVFLGLLNPFVFLLPHESGERVTFSVTILLSFAVFLNVIGDNVPKTSSPMPLLCHYVVIVLVSSGIITLLNTLCQKLYHARGQEPVPRWLQGLLCISSVRARNKIVNVCVKDKTLVTEGKCTVAQDTPIVWREAILRLDIISFVLFFSFAVALAIGYIISMTNLQSGGL